MHAVLEASSGCTSFRCVQVTLAHATMVRPVHFTEDMKGMCTDSFNANKITGSVETQHAQRP